MTRNADRTVLPRRAHVETFTARSTGEQIRVWCDCPIGTDHPSGPPERTDDQSAGRGQLGEP